MLQVQAESKGIVLIFQDESTFQHSRKSCNILRIWKIV